MLKIFYFPSQEGQHGVPLVKKSVSLAIQVARNCRLTEVGKRFMPRSYALALAQGEHIDCWLVEENGGGGLAGGDCISGEGCLKRSCRLPPQRGAEQGHLEVAGVWQDGDARQEVDRTRGVWVCRPAGGDPQLALWHLLVVECKKYNWQNLGVSDSKRV